MEILDTPVSLKYNHGNNFPPNVKMIAYIMLFFSFFISLSGSLILGGILLLLSLLAITNRYIVLIDPENNFIREYSLFLGFIKIGKKYPLHKYKYITSMPLIESQRVYGRTSNSTTMSNNSTAVTLFGENFRGKRIITKFDSKSEATDIAKRLGHRLNLKFFDYDPLLVRQVLLGQKKFE